MMYLVYPFGREK
jgi:hypothetical protein